jgi:thioredoxin 2
MSEAVHLVCGDCGGVNRVPQERLAEGPKCGKCRAPLADGALVELTARNFDKFIARNDLPVVVDFWAEWCGPCKMMAPVFAQLAGEQRTRFRFAKLDTDAQGAIAQRYGIRSIPSLVVFRHGQEVDRVAGAMDASRLRTFLARHAE